MQWYDIFESRNIRGLQHRLETSGRHFPEEVELISFRVRINCMMALKKSSTGRQYEISSESRPKQEECVQVLSLKRVTR